ncbi:hypothetical protein BC835DRAFT_1416498 [Cytidiella melzeri]|nr:hypothetical protein BC835DRAFT_1416498 [Cytidiella melzeri]
MALSRSPRKPLAPLATGVARSTLKSDSDDEVIRRAFFAAVVVEGSEYELSSDYQKYISLFGLSMDLKSTQSESQQPPSDNHSSTDLSQSPTVTHLRKRATTLTSGSTTPTSSSEAPSPTGLYSRKRANTINAALSDTINELVTTERTYVKRLRTLKSDYADPLRTFARSKDTAIIPSYEATTLFGNIDQLLPVNEAFLADLEMMLSPDGDEVGGVGDVALAHFKHRRGFENYKRYYAKREEAQAIFEREVRRTRTSGSGFSAFIDRIQYAAAANNRNRIGLRELLMEPVQRIPRYTLLFRQMIKQMPTDDPQREKLIEADELASKIAAAEIDDQTKRAATMYLLKAAIEDFPPGLWSNSRGFVDSLDVVDLLQPGVLERPGTPSTATGLLNASLLLFDDKLVIVKRLNSEKSARALSGLDELDKVVSKVKSYIAGGKKPMMVYKGMTDAIDVICMDNGGSEIHLFLENPPADQSGVWGQRQFRQLSVVSPSSTSLDPIRSEDAKWRFLQNLWEVQARYRTKNGQSVVLVADEEEVERKDESKDGKTTMAHTYFNIYQRLAFLQESNKACAVNSKVVVHVDPTGTADPINLGIRGPFMVARVRPMSGGLSSLTITSQKHSFRDEEIVDNENVRRTIINAIHQSGLFTPKTGSNSTPATPSTTRSRAGILGLEAISRNLFHARPGANKGDIFGGSMNAHKRSKTTIGSRTSAYTASTVETAGTGSISHFMRSRSNSISTGETSALDDDAKSIAMSLETDSHNSRHSHSISKKLVNARRPKSPASAGGGSGNELEPGLWTDADDDYDSDVFEEGKTISAITMDQSELDLTARLVLARKNSQSQPEQHFASSSALRLTETTIYEYEDDPPQPVASSSRITKTLPEIPAQYGQNFMPHQGGAGAGETFAVSRPGSRSGDRRPTGPRSASPLPPPIRTRELSGGTRKALDDLEDTFAEYSSSSHGLPTTPLPRSKRQMFDSSGTAGRTSVSSTLSYSSDVSSKTVEPLSIKRKPSTGHGASPHRTRQYNVGRGSPMTRPPTRTSSKSSLRKLSAQLNARAQIGTFTNEEAKKMLKHSDEVKAKLVATQGNVVRLRTTYEQSKTVGLPSTPELDRPVSPVKGFRSSLQRPPPSTPMTREAQARMEEMQRVILRRGGDGPTPRRPLSVHQEDSPNRSPFGRPREDVTATAMNDIAKQMETEVADVLAGYEGVQNGLKLAVIRNIEMSKDLMRESCEVINQKRSHELTKDLLERALTEMTAMYTAMKAEIEKIFREVEMPEDEALDTIFEDLRLTKLHNQKLEEQVRSRSLLIQHGITQSD